MTDWLAWLLEKLEEEEDQEEDLDLGVHVLPGNVTEEIGEIAEERSNRTGAMRRGVWISASEAAEEEEYPAEDREETRDGRRERDDLPMEVRRLSEARLVRAARQAGADQAWQTGTPAEMGETRTAASGGRTVPPAPDIGDPARGPARTELELYTAVRRARTAAEQAQGLRQAGPVVIREPVAVGEQGTTPAELDRIFQRDARRYDGGFTLF